MMSLDLARFVLKRRSEVRLARAMPAPAPTQFSGRNGAMPALTSTQFSGRNGVMPALTSTHSSEMSQGCGNVPVRYLQHRQKWVVLFCHCNWPTRQQDQATLLGNPDVATTQKPELPLLKVLEQSGRGFWSMKLVKPANPTQLLQAQLLPFARIFDSLQARQVPKNRAILMSESPVIALIKHSLRYASQLQGQQSLQRFAAAGQGVQAN